jgi:DeoR family fructose operon transcriptional repressor
MGSAERTVGLIDATKFGRAAMLSIARAQDLDAIVTDGELPPDVADEYRVAGVRLEIANPQESP